MENIYPTLVAESLPYTLTAPVEKVAEAHKYTVVVDVSVNRF